MFYSFLTSITLWKMINELNNITWITFDKTESREQNTNKFVRRLPVRHIVIKYKKVKLKKTIFLFFIT